MYALKLDDEHRVGWIDFGCLRLDRRADPAESYLDGISVIDALAQCLCYAP